MWLVPTPPVCQSAIVTVRRAPALAAVTWGYLAWSLVPVLAAVVASLGGGPFAALGQPVSLDAYRFAIHDPVVGAAFVHSIRLALATVALAVPMGTALGMGLRHVRGRWWHGVRGSLLLIIALPHTALAVALFYLFAFVVRANLDATAQLAAHVTIALPFVTLIVWIRMLLLDPTYEEQAADLGSPPLSTLRRVLLPLCAPAILVGATVAFTLSFNEIPLSDLLCLPNDCRTVPVLLGAPRGGDVPATAYAISVVSTVVSLVALAIAIVAIRIGRRLRAE
jgi:spermidine/putrescine transport system permease protein